MEGTAFYDIIQTCELYMHYIISAAILLFEFIGVCVIIYSGISAFIKMIRKDSSTKVYLARGLAMGLEFKLGSEILRTVIVRDWSEIGVVAGIIVLRAGLAFLIHWEIKEAEKESHLKSSAQ